MYILKGMSLLNSDEAVVLYKNIIKTYETNKYSIKDKILTHYIVFLLFKDKLKFLDEAEFDTLSDNFFDYELNQRINISKQELLEIREILKEIGKYDILNFLETFIDLRKKNDKNKYFDENVPELYEDIKGYIYKKYFNVNYGSQELIIRDIDIDINEYILPLLWKELSLKLFDFDIKFDNQEIQKHIIEFINNGGFTEYK